jgi:hypothetical protein
VNNAIIVLFPGSLIRPTKICKLSALYFR